MKCYIYLWNKCIRAAQKEVPPILLYWTTTLEMDVDGMAVEAESSCQYPITFCFCVTDGNWGAVWQNGTWHESVYEAKVWHWILPGRKSFIHWYSLMLSEWSWRWSSGWEHSEVVGGVFQQWWKWDERQATFWMAMQICMSMACRLLIITGKNA